MIEKNPLQHLTRRDTTLRNRRAARKIHAARAAQLETLEDRVVLAVGAGVPAIMGTVFDDLNTDGRPSDGEGIAGISVQLYQDDGDGLFESGGIDPLVGTQSSDANGDYCFADLEADSRYFVVRENQTVDGTEFERFVSGAVNPGLANTLIDEFLTRQVATANPPAPSTEGSVLSFPNESEVLGGERDLMASLAAGNSEINIRVNPFGLEDVLLFDAAAGDSGTLNVTWDGIDNDAGTIGLGLAGRDLTDGGTNTGIMLRAGQDGNESSLKVRIYQGSARSFSEVSVALPETGGDADGFVFIPFSDFVGAVSPTNVDAIQMLIDAGQSGDGTIDVIGLTGPKVVNIGETINADLWITKDNAVSTVVPGEPVTYVIVARNAGPADVIGARVTDQFPANLQNVSYTSRVSGTASGNTLVGTGAIDDLLDITSGSSVTYTVQGTVDDDATGFLANTARITPPPGVIDSNLGNNTSSDRDIIGRPIDLRVSKDDGVRIVEPGDELTYTIVFSNFGPGTIDRAIAQDLFPDNLENVSYSSVGSTGTSGYTEAGQGNIQDRLVIPEGGRVTYTVSATVSAEPGGTVVNRASIDVPEGFVDTTPENNIEIDTNLVNRAVADLSITKTDNRSTVSPGEQVTYQIVVANNGPANAARIQIFDVFPPELENVSFTSAAAGGAQGNSTSGTEDIDDIVSMDVGSTITYTVVGTVVASATGTVTNTATVSSPIPDSNPDNNSSTDIDNIAAQVDLSVTKTNGVSQVNPGDDVTYTIVATNNGPSEVVGMSIVDQFPSTLVNATYDRTVHGETTTGAGSINDTLDLPVGEAVTYVVNGTVDSKAAGTLVNTVTVQPPRGVQEINPADNAATDSDPIIRSDVDLAITKRSNSLTVIPGRPIQYEIVVSNIGQTNVSGALVRDIIPDAITDVSYQSVATPGASGNTASGLGNVEDTVDLNVGSSIIYTVLGQVQSSATGVITNTATVEVGGDSVPGNNTAVDTVVTDPHFDLSITKDDGIHEVKIGDQVTYSITVRNDGPSDVSNANVRDFFPHALENVTYSSTAFGGATGNLNGTGNINDVVSIPAGGAITYVATGTVGIDVSGTLTNTATVTGPDGFTELDPNNNSASDVDVLTGVVVLGSEPTVIRRDSIVGEADTDVFEITAHDTGKMIFNIHFTHQFGDLDLEVTDRNGSSIAVSASESDNEQLVLPVVSQETYFVRVFGKNGDTNLYDLEIENFAASVPVVARIAPGSDTGMMNDDAITSEGNPRLLLQADLSDFRQMGIDILSPVDPTVDTSQIPTAAGVAVEVVITNSQTGGMIRGFATPVGDSTTLFAFTPVGQLGNRTFLTDGEYFANAAVRVYDGAQVEGAATPATGRTQLSDPYWFVIDQTLPRSAERPDLFRVSDSGMSDSDNVTSKMAPAIGGLGEPNTKVRLLGNREGLGLAEIIGQGVVNSNGEWEITTEPLVDGIHHIRAEFEDMAGNISDLGEPLVIEVDTRAPNTPYLDLVRDSDTGMRTADDVTNRNALTFTMTTEDPGQADHIFQFNYKYRLFVRPDSASDGVTGEELLIYDSAIDDTIPIGELLDGLTNNQLLTKTMAELPDGVHNFKLEVEDRAGNISEDYLLPVTIDTQAPPATVDMIDSSDGGMLNDDNVTNKMQPAFAGLSEVGSKVNIFANGILVGQGSVTTDVSDGAPADGLGLWEVTVEPLVDGEYAVTSQVTDLAGNSSTSTELPIWVDTTKPNIPFLDLVSDSGIDTSDNITNDMTPTVTVTAGATVGGGANEFPNDIKYRIYDRPGDGGGDVLIIDSYGALQDFTTGGFFVETLPMLDEGVHNLKLEVEDRAGNISDAFLLDIEIDKTSPTVTAALLPASDSGMFDDDNVTSINAPTIVGTGSIGDRVFVLANGTLVGEGNVGSDETDGVVGNGLGAWQVTIDPIDDGQHEITAFVEE